MARQKHATPAPLDTDVISAEALGEDFAAAPELSQRLAKIDATYGDGLPYDAARLVTEVRMLLSHSAEAMLEAGKRLLLLKEHEPQGDFYCRLDAIGIDLRMARRLMQAAVKYTQRLPEAKAERLVQLGRSKLLELMVIDDDQLEALADGGTVAGMALDEVDKLSVSELREALRKEKKARADEAEVKERLLADKNGKIDQLAEELAKRDKPGIDETAAARINHERAKLDALQQAAFDALASVHDLAQAVADMLADHPTESQMTAAETTVQWLFQRINEVALENGIPVDFGEIVVPSWAQGAVRVPGIAREE